MVCIIQMWPNLYVSFSTEDDIAKNKNDTGKNMLPKRFSYNSSDVEICTIIMPFDMQYSQNQDQQFVAENSWNSSLHHQLCWAACTWKDSTRQQVWNWQSPPQSHWTGVQSLPSWDNLHGRKNTNKTVAFLHRTAGSNWKAPTQSVYNHFHPKIISMEKKKKKKNFLAGQQVQIESPNTRSFPASYNIHGETCFSTDQQFGTERSD